MSTSLAPKCASCGTSCTIAKSYMFMDGTKDRYVCGKACITNFKEDLVNFGFTREAIDTLRFTKVLEEDVVHV